MILFSSLHNFILNVEVLNIENDIHNFQVFFFLEKISIMIRPKNCLSYCPMFDIHIKFKTLWMCKRLMIFFYCQKWIEVIGNRLKFRTIIAPKILFKPNMLNLMCNFNISFAVYTIYIIHNVTLFMLSMPQLQVPRYYI